MFSHRTIRARRLANVVTKSTGPFREAGRNLLLLQVENLEYYVHFRVRLSDISGKALLGVTCSTSPRNR